MAIQFRFGRKSPWENVDLMSLVPEPARAAEIHPESGSVTVLMPRYDSWPFNRLIQPRLRPEKQYLRVPLEDRGSFIWGLMDGRRTVGEMVPDFQAGFPDDDQEVPQRLASFFYNMYENRLVRFVNFPI